MNALVLTEQNDRLDDGQPKEVAVVDLRFVAASIWNITNK